MELVFKVLPFDLYAESGFILYNVNLIIMQEPQARMKKQNSDDIERLD